MKSFVIINLDGIFWCLPCQFCAAKALIEVKFVFKDVIYPLSHSIFIAVFFFCHANLYFAFFPFFYIGMAAILHSSVGVMNHVSFHPERPITSHKLLPQAYQDFVHYLALQYVQRFLRLHHCQILEPNEPKSL